MHKVRRDNRIQFSPVSRTLIVLWIPLPVLLPLSATYFTEIFSSEPTARESDSSAQPDCCSSHWNPQALRSVGGRQSDPRVRREDPEPYLGTPASANTTAMPTEMDVDAAEPSAGGNVDSPNKTTAPNVRAYCRFAETEPEDTFAEARNRLTDTEREHIDKQMEKVYSSTNRSTGDYTGTSNGKGKSIDPRNWGGITLEGSEMDPLIQLEEFINRLGIQI
ncbi:hypothetical protein C0995_016645 [Termitomyces sp. Mi166|nr:hypothetical protein C0995_016645 [Termitomyces sp. Mi166\